jgi:hypothetical protein
VVTVYSPQSSPSMVSSWRSTQPAFICFTSSSSPQPGQLRISPGTVSAGISSSASQSGHFALFIVFASCFTLAGLIIILLPRFLLLEMSLRLRWVSFKHCDVFVTSWAFNVPNGA